MSTGKLDTSGIFQPNSSVQANQTKLLLSSEDVVVRKNGLEFLTPKPVPVWTEVSVDLRSPGESRGVHGTGVVIDCTGNRHTGYVVSLVFMNLTRQSQERLSVMAHAR